MSGAGRRIMHAQRYQLIKQIFQAAQALDVASRESFLAQACDGDIELRADVDRLLEADAGSSRFLESPVIDANLALDSAEAGGESLPERIGRYRVIQLLGEGGMGSVYEAEQDSPRRRVALKVLRAGTMQPRMLQRFQREVEVLGRLQHPGIARIYDAGFAEDIHAGGRTVRVPFFAMELIHGSPITTFATERSLPVRDRLALLADVCDAVHYGHQHGIVHRDLKPGNVLVGHADDEGAYPQSDGTMPVTPAPKIIDFGVARVTDADLVLTTAATETGQIIGTLAYMSPEQVRGNPDEIDARSDIYALGVIGYELLTDRLPYAVADKVAPEAARIISEEEPSRMSSISRVFRGDIETIFAKALEKEPARRYATASALASDIRRFLSDEPIIARPPTLGYQLAKFARRHKEFVAGLILVFVVLVAGIVGTSIALVHATRQATYAQRLNEGLQHFFDFSMPGNPGGGRDVTVHQMLDAVSDEWFEQWQDAPEIEIALRRKCGSMYARLDDHRAAMQQYARAGELIEQVYGPDSEQLFDIEAEIACLRRWDPNDRPTALAASEKLDRRLAEARKRFPPEHQIVQNLQWASGRFHSFVGHFDEAIIAFSDLLKILESENAMMASSK